MMDDDLTPYIRLCGAVLKSVIRDLQHNSNDRPAHKWLDGCNAPLTFERCVTIINVGIECKISPEYIREMILKNARDK